MPIINSVAAMQDEIAAWRRDIHENPEILYDVHRTAGVVADKLGHSAATRWCPASAGPAWSASSGAARPARAR